MERNEVSGSGSSVPSTCSITERNRAFLHSCCAMWLAGQNEVSSYWGIRYDKIHDFGLSTKQAISRDQRGRCCASSASRLTDIFTAGYLGIGDAVSFITCILISIIY